jgi:hypothetical protein
LGSCGCWSSAFYASAWQIIRQEPLQRRDKWLIIGGIFILLGIGIPIEPALVQHLVLNPI